jgi:large subunit ribosomal protein L6
MGQKPIEIPDKVKINIDGNFIRAEGPKGNLEQEIPTGIEVNVEDSNICVTRKNNSKLYKSLHGLTRSLIANMVIGVTEEFEKKLRVVGSGYRANVERQNDLVLEVGYSHAVHYTIPEGISVDVEEREDVDGVPHIPLVVRGVDKQFVGQIAAQIRDIKRPEVYKPSKGIRYDGERVRNKEGKTVV